MVTVMNAPRTPPWFVYIVRCCDQTLYTGITTNLTRRLQEHNSSKKGAKFTRARRPVQLVYAEQWSCRSTASKREYAIKKLTLPQKVLLINTSQKQPEAGRLCPETPPR